jgi:uncharacterized protein
MPDDKIIAYIKQQLVKKYGCHTAILYGSRARGDFTSASDYDVAGFSDRTKNVIRDARKYRGQYLDVFICPSADLKSPNAQQLHYKGGVVLFERSNLGSKFLAGIERIYKKGPAKPLAFELRVRKTWAQKMYDRGRAGDLEGLYRVNWLIMALLEDYFFIRRKWYLGSKASFQWFKKNDPATLSLFTKVLTNPRDWKSLQALVNKVVKR